MHPSTIAHEPSQILPYYPTVNTLHPPATIHPPTQIPSRIIMQSTISSTTIPNRHRNPSPSNIIVASFIPTPHDTSTIPSNITAAQCTINRPKNHTTQLNTTHPSTIGHKPPQISTSSSTITNIHPPPRPPILLLLLSRVPSCNPLFHRLLF